MSHLWACVRQSRNDFEFSTGYPQEMQGGRSAEADLRAFTRPPRGFFVLGVDGVADFDALHSRKHDDEVQFCAFDILVEGDDDLRKLPLHLRKTSLERRWRGALPASSSTRLNAARSGLTCSGRPADGP
jgi:ATP-dependent DNA ligase